MWRPELDLMIVGPFQLGMFYSSIILWLRDDGSTTHYVPLQYQGLNFWQFSVTRFILMQISLQGFKIIPMPI